MIDESPATTGRVQVGIRVRRPGDLGGPRERKAWNAAKNKVETWFGSAAPTNFDLVKVAVSGEVAKTFKGQVTDSELDKINAAVNKAESPGQLHGAIDNALQLMKSKMQANVEQYQQGRQGQPAFPSGTAPKFSQVKPGVMVEQ